MTAASVTLVEVGPRDGLQNEPRLVATRDKIALVEALATAGFARIEVASFVSATRVPQMADGAAVLGGIARRPGTTYSALTPNLRGYAAARAAGADAVAVFAAASEGFSARNLGCDIATSLGRFAEVTRAAAADGVMVRGYVSCVVGCPYDGAVAPRAVARVAGALWALGCHEIALGDTIGCGTPAAMDALLTEVAQAVPPAHLAGHFHDTNGRACDSVAVALDHGIVVFDGAVAGLGGCPFAPGARGNLDTATLARAVAARGFGHGIDLDTLGQAARLARRLTAPVAVGGAP